MPNLSSFISYGKALRKPKGFNRRLDTPNSPHPYASTEVVHITPTQSLHSDEEGESSGQLPFQSPPTSEDFSSPQLTPVRPSTPPKKLDVQLLSDSMSDWIPSHLLLDEKLYNAEAEHQSPGASSSKLPEDHISTQQARDEETLPDEASVYDDDDYSSSSNDSIIVANLQAMDASSFVKTRDKPVRMLPRKNAPSPIKIPNSSMHGPKVQVVRSSTGSNRGTWYPSSRPESAHSGEDYSASAVSGTTLARALIGNSFVLSSDDRTSRYRSGGSVLTRTDSATLPHDENPFLYSPLSRTPEPHSLVPLPPNADSVYIPPKNPRRRLSDSKRKRQSTGSILRDTDGEASLTSSATSDSVYTPSPFLSPNVDRPVSNVSRDGPSSASSAKEYDNMLDDYYSTVASMSPEPPTREDFSQLSPPSPYRRDSRRSTKTGTGSPNGPRILVPGRLLPIGESSQQNGAPVSPDSASSLLPPPTFSLFNRQRSGSAPSPIKIVRDSQDLTSYNLISTRPASSSSSPTSSPEYSQPEYSKQTFPETPRAFSPIWSATSVASTGLHGHHNSIDQIVIAVPATPIPAGDPMPALAQHMLARAASGARHQRQPSGSRVRTVAPTKDISPPPIPPEPESSAEDKEISHRYPSWVTQKFPTSDGERSPSLTSPLSELSPRHDHLVNSNSSQTSLGVRGLPTLPPSPSIFAHNFANSTTSLPSPAVRDALSSQDSLRSVMPVSVSTSNEVSAVTPPPPPPPPPPLPPHPQQPPLPPHHIQQQSKQSPGSAGSAETELGAPYSLGSPPPYYTLVFDQSQGHSDTPTSGGSHIASPNTPPSSRSDSLRQSTSSFGRRGRSRPPLPLGPRRPSHTATTGRQRNGSVSSINSNAAGGSSKLFRTASGAPAPHSPRSRPSYLARSNSPAEASAIRLLHLETVDNDIPAELHKLELQRTEIKTRYKMIARRRMEMLAALTSHVDGSQQEDANATLGIINEVRDISVTLDRLAQDLHAADEQVSQLTSLKDVHGASALAMAIRKLNASFLKQLAVSDALQSQVLALEAERDDAWKQAEKGGQRL
ncbi:hypothetical protein BDP27DRAFT_1412427 [Rhodocollybia butyracea]|uniref:Uncharacterized protein n=1 Tax=Rhodocollybia butyracea TaxID=206335 RepID=A0A9P5UH29_9AGAR|nr:hypothetical protein BDP27DRAFT_1412427 [Rhodocollybia butyracea]